MRRRHWLHLTGGAATAVFVGAVPALARSVRSDTPVFALRKPGCRCCEGWAEHLRENGFTVHLHDSPDLQAVKERLRVPEDLEGCHTAIVEGYVVEGHIPAAFITRLLDEGLDVAGIAVPGMPQGSPGMESTTPEPFDVIAFAGPDGARRTVLGTVRP